MIKIMRNAPEKQYIERKPKARRMLSFTSSPACEEILRIIPTRSISALSCWAIHYSMDQCLGIFDAHTTSTDGGLRHALDTSVDLCLGYAEAMSSSVTIRRGAVGPALKNVSKLVCAETDPTAQAAARAISIACASVRTPSSVFGFLFYLAAAKAYDAAGIGESVGFYDDFTSKVMAEALNSLKSETEPDPQNPCRIFLKL